MEKLMFIKISDEYHKTGPNAYGRLTILGEGKAYMPIHEMFEENEFKNSISSIGIIHPDTKRGRDTKNCVITALRKKFDRKTKIKSLESSRLNAPITDRLYAMEQITDYANGYVSLDYFQIAIVIADEESINPLMNEFIGKYLESGHDDDFFSIGRNLGCVVTAKIEEGCKIPEMSYYG